MPSQNIFSLQSSLYANSSCTTLRKTSGRMTGISKTSYNGITTAADNCDCDLRFTHELDDQYPTTLARKSHH